MKLMPSVYHVSDCSEYDNKEGNQTTKESTAVVNGKDNQHNAADGADMSMADV
jgi:hypothetical protein